MGMKLLPLILLLILVIMIFGTRRLRNIGDDLAQAIKSFRKGLKDNDKPKQND